MKLDKILDAPKENAQMFLDDAMSYIECQKYHEAYKKFEKINEWSVDGFSKSVTELSKIICTKYRILSMIMMSSW